jgi:hypothetical protein
VVRLLHRRTEVRHHRVADELVDGPAVLEDPVRDQLEDLVQEGDHPACLHALGEVGESADVAEQDGELPLHALQRLVLGSLQQLVQDVVAHVAPEGILDPLLLLERVAHLVERTGQLSHLVPGGGRHPNREVAVPEPLDADPEPPQRAHQERHEDDARGDAQADQGQGDDGELAGGRPHHRLDQHLQVELDLGLTDPQPAVEDRGADQQARVAAEHAGGVLGPPAMRVVREPGDRVALLVGIHGGHHRALSIQQPGGDDAVAHAHLLDEAVEHQLDVEGPGVHVEQGVLGGAGQAADQRHAALLHLGFQGVTLVPGGHQRQARAGHHQERDHHGAELHLERSQAGIRPLRGLRASSGGLRRRTWGGTRLRARQATPARGGIATARY